MNLVFVVDVFGSARRDTLFSKSDMREMGFVLGSTVKEKQIETTTKGNRWRHGVNHHLQYHHVVETTINTKWVNLQLDTVLFNFCYWNETFLTFMCLFSNFCCFLLFFVLEPINSNINHGTHPIPRHQFASSSLSQSRPLLRRCFSDFNGYDLPGMSTLFH